MFDFLIRGARILDGSGREAFFGDVGITGGTIAAVGDLSQAEGGSVLDAAGRYLAPGFIDVHRHGDAALFRPGYGRAELAQGLTTVLNGNCGLSLSPLTGPFRQETARYLQPIVGALPEGRDFPTLADYRAQAGAAAPPIHAGMLVGMGTLRACVAGFADGPLSDEQYRRLHTLLEGALADGARGVSLGLGYAPECFYDTAGLIRALEPLRGSGTIITVHMRQEGDGVVDALEEMLTVARALKTPVEISHLKAIGRRNWDRAVPQMLERIENARQEGLAVGCDVYPYPAGSTQLIHVLPPEFQTGGTAALTAALRDSGARREMRRRMETGRDFENIVQLVGFENVLATSLRRPEHQPFEGRSIAQIAEEQGKDPYDALFDLLAAEECTVSMIDFIAAESDIDAILRAPFSCVISDATYPAGGLLHRRVYGTFARLIETYVVRRGVLTLPQAVHKVTGLSAERFGLSGKGRILPGYDADLCLFDPDRVREEGTWQDPERLASGMDDVFVSGVPAIAEGRFTGACRGQSL
ncbi:MAG: amidohydrolase family protein [Oscillibacter sp.]|nr:amidohydrolase family protein [Oscillibacter sp.]